MVFRESIPSPSVELRFVALVLVKTFGNMIDPALRNREILKRK